jgi:hypothetical protein
MWDINTEYFQTYFGIVLLRYTCSYLQWEPYESEGTKMKFAWKYFVLISYIRYLSAILETKINEPIQSTFL